MTETKTAPVTLVIEPSIKEILARISTKNRVSFGHIVREAIYEYLERYAPNGFCPNCNGTEINHRDRPGDILAPIVEVQCRDCMTEWEVE